jgi:hypothetical protein
MYFLICPYFLAPCRRQGGESEQLKGPSYTQTLKIVYAKTGPEVGMNGINVLGGARGRRECQNDKTMPK